MRRPGARAVVAFGDSITDGDGSTVDGNDRWPDRLAERLAKVGGPPVAVLNQGISGAKVLTDRMGVNALARFDTDVLSQPQADTVILMMGINDLGWPGQRPRAARARADRRGDHRWLQAIDRTRPRAWPANHRRDAHARSTTRSSGTPFEGYYTPEKEKIRVALNDFIRSGAFDGVIDFDKIIVDPQKPGYSLPKYDKGDHLHPNAAGYEAMGGAIDLNTMTTN